jgi:class 3 adenylate cyclase
MARVTSIHEHVGVGPINKGSQAGLICTFDHHTVKKPLISPTLSATCGERGSVATTEDITVLFTDLVGSTELASSLTLEAGDEVRHKHFSALRQAIATTGGTEVKNLGDGLMVVFPAASAALSCSVAMQQAVHRDNAGAERQLGLRVGLSSGEATREADDYFGDPVIEAARLCARA